MAKPVPRWISRVRRAGILALGLCALGALGAATLRSRATPAIPPDLPLATVRRIDLHSTVTAPGQVESAEKTLIECELERLSFRNGGGSIQASGSSAIIELVPEGTMVEKGQVICRLDSSEYEEMVRQQQLELEEDRAQYNSARLQLETLEVALKEYRDGQFQQLKEQYLGQIALAKGDLARQQDRLVWSERMAELGYIPLSRLTSERNMTLRAEIVLNEATLAYDNLVKYKAPKTILTMEGQLYGARVQLSYHETRVKRDEEQLAEYQEQVENCTIRAPHDGFLIYANEDNDDTRIEPGTTVRQNQDLFYLPDLTQMQVHTELHETVVNRVQPGMPVRVRVEALPGLEIEGEVVAVAPLPISIRSWRQSDDVKNFLGTIALHVVPEGLMPGMTAEVEIVTAQRPESLVIPPQALAVDGGQDVCYVAAANGLVRRPVTIGEYHHDMIEVVDGLNEGDRIVTAPDRIDRGTVIAEPTDGDETTVADDATTETAALAESGPAEVADAPSSLATTDAAQPTL